MNKHIVHYFNLSHHLFILNVVIFEHGKTFSLQRSKIEKFEFFFELRGIRVLIKNICSEYILNYLMTYRVSG